MNSQIQKIQTYLRQGLRYSLRLPADGGKEETMRTPRIGAALDTATGPCQVIDAIPNHCFHINHQSGGFA